MRAVFLKARQVQLPLRQLQAPRVLRRGSVAGPGKATLAVLLLCSLCNLSSEQGRLEFSADANSKLANSILSCLCLVLVGRLKNHRSRSAELNSSVWMLFKTLKPVAAPGQCSQCRHSWTA